MHMTEGGAHNSKRALFLCFVFVLLLAHKHGDGDDVDVDKMKPHRGLLQGLRLGFL